MIMDKFFRVDMVKVAAIIRIIGIGTHTQDEIITSVGISPRTFSRYLNTLEINFGFRVEWRRNGDRVTYQVADWGGLNGSFFY